VAAVAVELSPLPPRIRLRVGVSGHRAPPKLPADSEAPLRSVLDRILSTIVETAREAAASDVLVEPAAKSEEAFVVVSSLAEGADRLVAEAGVSAGYALEAVLPFARAEYAKDFETAESQAAFETLLAQSSAVFELNGKVEERPRAYEAAGFVMLANVDLMIAIWDGKEAAGAGGTAQIVNRAIADGIPVIRLDPQNPTAIQIYWPDAEDLAPAHAYTKLDSAFRPADEATVALVTQDILSAPDGVRERLPKYLAEKQRRWNFCLWYPLLLWAFAGARPSLAQLRLPAPLPETTAQWKTYFELLPRDRAQGPVIETLLLPAFSAADHLAVYYSLVYRSTYVFNFLFAALAVALALCGVLIHDIEVQIGGKVVGDTDIKAVLVAVEFCIILSILVTWYCGNKLQWHRRWLEYRRLAESLRHMRILAVLGSDGPVDRPGRSGDVEDEDWVNWYAWSMRRLIPLPDRVVDAGYLAAVREVVRTAEISGQADYHRRNARRMEKLERGMHHTGQMLFGFSGILCLGYLILYFAGVLPDIHSARHDIVLGLFTFVTAILPTFGAALGAIYAQGDFRTVAEQSERTAARLEAIDKVLADEPLEFARLADRVQKTSDTMMADLEEWQTVFRTRPLSLPA
jgi:hypothetical protein